MDALGLVEFQGPWTETDRGRLLATVAQVRRRLRDHDLNHVVADVPVRFRHTKHWAGLGGLRFRGTYRLDKNDVLVSCRDLDDVHDIVLHEFGHALFFRGLSENQRIRFDAWVDRRTELLPLQRIAHWTAKSRATSWHELARTLLRRAPTLAWRIRHLVRRTHKIAGWHRRTPDLPLPLELMDIHTFRHAFTRHCHIDVDNDYPDAWEIFAEAVVEHLSGRWVPGPLLKRVRQDLDPLRVSSDGGC